MLPRTTLSSPTRSSAAHPRLDSAWSRKWSREPAKRQGHQWTSTTVNRGLTRADAYAGGFRRTIANRLRRSSSPASRRGQPASETAAATLVDEYDVDGIKRVSIHLAWGHSKNPPRPILIVTAQHEINPISAPGCLTAALGPGYHFPPQGPPASLCVLEDPPCPLIFRVPRAIVGAVLSRQFEVV